MPSRTMPVTLLGILLAMASSLGCGAEPTAVPAATAAKGPAPAAKSLFLRLVRDDKRRPKSLQTATVRFAAPAEGDKGIVVDLVAAVHIADKDYYRQLNRQFEGYDAVLYELVAPRGTRVPKGGRKGGDNPLSTVQKGLKDLLALEFQLDQVDYTRKNFVHADLSPDEFLRSMRDRGESIWEIFGRLVGYSIAKQAGGTDGQSEVALLMALFSKDRAMALKRVMAEQFEDLEAITVIFEGPNGSTLIGQRNKAAVEVLQKQVAAGKRKIAIFYGAAHMADMEKRLRGEFGLAPTETRWLTAWDLRKPAGR